MAHSILFTEILAQTDSVILSASFFCSLSVPHGCRLCSGFLLEITTIGLRRREEVRPDNDRWLHNFEMADACGPYHSQRSSEEGHRAHWQHYAGHAESGGQKGPISAEFTFITNKQARRYVEKSPRDF